MAWRTGRSVLVVAAAVLLVAANAVADEGTIAERSFAVSGSGLLRVDSDQGSIEVTSGGAGAVEVRVTYDARRNDRDEVERFLRDFKVDFSQTGNNVTVKADFEGSRSWRRQLGSTPGVTFVVTVPRVFDVDLSTGGGGISVSDLEGEVRARTSGGGLRFGRIVGDVHGRTSGGGIRLAGCRGDADVETSGGSIRIGEVEGRVRAHTSGGSIEVDAVAGDIDASTSGGSIEATITKQPVGDCRLSTSGGSVTVRLAADIAVNLDARGNRVRNELPIMVSGDIDRGHLYGTLNGGGPDLVLRTSGGSVRIMRD